MFHIVNINEVVIINKTKSPNKSIAIRNKSIIANIA